MSRNNLKTSLSKFRKRNILWFDKIIYARNASITHECCIVLFDILQVAVLNLIIELRRASFYALKIEHRFQYKSKDILC